jgi:hypothetical protein
VVVKDNLPSAFKDYAGKKFTFWVSSSSDYVDKFDFFKHMFDKYPALSTIVKYKKPLDFYDTGVTGFTRRLVVSIVNMQVLDERLQPIVRVEKQTLLGEYIGAIDSQKKKFIKFRTVDNTERWADASTIKIIER